MIPVFRKKLIIHIAVNAGIVLALFAFVLLLRADIRGKSERIASLQSQIAFRREAISSFVELQQELEQVEPYLSVLNNLFLDQNELINLPKQLREIAAAEGIELDFVFSTETPATDSLPGYINFQMSADGSLPSILSFLKKIEAGPYFLAIDTFNLAFVGKTFSADMNGRAFSQ